MHYLVTGGAGYIGSHIVKALVNRGDTATILDNFSTGHRWATQDQEILELDLRDLPTLKANLEGRVFDGVFHFAAKSLVGESNTDPIKYYQNNVGGTANLLEVALQNSWHQVVLSSTAAVYGNPLTERISEDHPKKPVNVYGDTKLSMENMLEALCSTSELSAVCLRYFNAAGATDDGSIGEWHEPETHLIPNALRAASGAGTRLTIFGTDYPTPDGTCIRDYIHVDDLADAHLKAMKYTQENRGFHAFNLGNGQGFSVKEVVSACEKVVKSKIAHTVGERRAGDPGILVADARSARTLLGWQPARRNIAEIAASAWHWEQNRKLKISQLGDAK